MCAIRLTGPDARDEARTAIGVAPRGTVVLLLPMMPLACTIARAVAILLAIGAVIVLAPVAAELVAVR